MDRRRRRRAREPERRSRSTAPAPATWRAQRAPASAPGRSTSRATTCSTAPSASRTSSPTPTGPLSAYGRSKLAGEQARRRAPRPSGHTIVRSSWLFGAGGRASRRRSCELAAERDELTRRRRPGRLPDVHRTSRRGARRARRRARADGLFHVAGAGSCSWFEFAQAIVAAAGLDCEVKPARTRRHAAAGDAARVQRARHRARRAAPALPDWRDGLDAVHGAEGAGAMRLLVCGGAGFIGSTFVRVRVREHGDEVTVLDKLTYAGRRENLHDVIDEIRFFHGAIEDPAAVADAVARLRRDRQLRGRDPRRPLDRGARGVHHDQHAGHARAARGGTGARPALPPGLDRRGLRLDRGGVVHRGVAARSPRARTARPRPAPICSSAATSTRTGWRR